MISPRLGVESLSELYKLFKEKLVEFTGGKIRGKMKYWYDAKAHLSWNTIARCGFHSNHYITSHLCKDSPTIRFSSRCYIYNFPHAVSIAS